MPSKWEPTRALMMASKRIQTWQLTDHTICAGCDRSPRVDRAVARGEACDRLVTRGVTGLRGLSLPGDGFAFAIAGTKSRGRGLSTHWGTRA